MPNYAWKGRNRAGLVQEGVLAADSKDVAQASGIPDRATGQPSRWAASHATLRPRC